MSARRSWQANGPAAVWLFLVCALIVTLTLAFALPAYAGSTPAITDVTLAPETATVGDRLTLTVVVEHDAGSTVERPRFDGDFGGLDLIEITGPRTQTGDGASRTTLTYIFTSFETGVITTPPLAIAYRGPGGAGELLTPARAVHIEPTVAPGDNSLRPLKPQLDIDAGAPAALLPAAVVAVFAVLTAFAYVLFTRAAQERPVEARGPTTPLPTPYEAARTTLDALAGAASAPADLPAFYAAISATIRRYLSDVFGFPAYAMTRTELRREMSRAAMDRWPARLAANLLEQCDAVQFGGFLPASERIDADLTAAYEILDLTNPTPPLPVAAETAVAPS